jgi:drug/metabolite transporter (DMT)-like permease
MSPVDRRPPVYPLLVLCFGILAVSTGSIFTRFAQVNAPSLVIAAGRLTIASIILFPIAATRRRGEIFSLKQGELLLVLLSGFFLALHFATWISSLAFTSVASSVVLVTTTPLWVALLAPFTLNERISRPTMIGMVLALMGGIIIGLSDSCIFFNGRLICPALNDFIQGRAFLGDLLALIGAIMAAAYVIIGRRMRNQMSLVGYIFVVYGMAALVLVILMLLAGESPIGYPPSTYLWILLLALIPQLLGHSSFNWALGYVSAAYVSITLLGEPIGATILAYFLLHEKPTVMKIFGAILILAGIYIASRTEMNKNG